MSDFSKLQREYDARIPEDDPPAERRPFREWRVMSSTTVRARKTHTCLTCQRQINSGEIYKRTSGIYCDHPVSAAQCVMCTSDETSDDFE